MSLPSRLLLVGLITAGLLASGTNAVAPGNETARLVRCSTDTAPLFNEVGTCALATIVS